MKMWVWVFVFVYSSVLWSQRIDPSHQLLWQISGKGLKKPSYLFGSFHSNDHRLFDFTDSTYSAIIHADAIVLEADVYSMFTQFDSRVAETDLKFDSRGKPYTTDIRASRTKYGNEDGRPQFLDAYLQQIAFNSGKKFFALESVESQLALFDDISFQNYKAFNLKSLTYTQEGILQSYLHGNIDQMRAMLKSQLAISANAYNLLITDRNVKMTQKIDSLCRKQSLFVAVGAGHLAGEEGIIALLRQKGYTVRQVVATFSEEPTKEELKLHEYNWYHYSNEDFFFKVDFTGKPIVDTTAEHLKLVYQEMGQGNTYWIEVQDRNNDNNLSGLLDELFYLPNQATLSEFSLTNGIQAFEGITHIDGIGNCWRRVFIYENRIYKLTCFGGNKFMNSDRPQRFFNRIQLL